MKNKLLLFAAGLTVSLAITLYAATVKISRTGQNTMLVIGGTTTTNGKVALVSGDTNTNQYELVTSTATVALNATTATNSFSTSFLATPVALVGRPSGMNATQNSNFWSVIVTVTSSNLLVSGLSTNASTGVNNVPIMLYGYKTTGQFE